MGYNKKIIDMSVGASLMPTAMSSIDSADTGPLGKATKKSMLGGFALEMSKGFFK